MTLSPEFEARRSEACEKIERIVEEYRDVARRSLVRRARRDALTGGVGSAGDGRSRRATSMGRALTAVTFTELREALGFDEQIGVVALYVDPMRRLVHVVVDSHVLIECEDVEGVEPEFWPIEALRQPSTVLSPPAPPVVSEIPPEAFGLRFEEKARPWVRVQCSTIGCSRANGHLSECDGVEPVATPAATDVVGVRVIVGGCVECRGGMAIVRCFFDERALWSETRFDTRCFDCGAVVPGSKALFTP